MVGTDGMHGVWVLGLPLAYSCKLGDFNEIDML